MTEQQGQQEQQEPGSRPEPDQHNPETDEDTASGGAPEPV